MKPAVNSTHNILVVDDDPDISMMLKLMLEYKGYSVTVLSKVEETVKTLEGDNYSMAIIDMLLSGVSGIDICSSIRKNHSTAKCPVLMISAHPNAKEICLQAGADDFISKPFDMNDILSRITHLVNKH
ncbi:MAG TPA: response regulator [Chitinophagaceae bacterium]|nr:response regulator [Chitinophagaceae bacterium]